MATINDIARESARIQALGPQATWADIQGYQNLFRQVYNAGNMGSGLMDPRQLMDMANKLGANITKPNSTELGPQGPIGTNPEIGFGQNGGPTPAPYQAPPTGGLLDSPPPTTGGAGTPGPGGFPPGVDPNNPFPPTTGLPSPPAPTNPGATVPYTPGPTRPGLPTPGNPGSQNPGLPGGGQPVFQLPPGVLDNTLAAFGYTSGPNGEVLPLMLQGGWSPYQPQNAMLGNAGFASQQPAPLLPQLGFNPDIGQYEYWTPQNPQPPAAGAPPTDPAAPPTTTDPGTNPGTQPGTPPPRGTNPGRTTPIRYSEKGLLGMPTGGGGGGLLGAAIPPALMGLLR